MFKKTFKQKSQIHLRSSEKKKFIAELRVIFPALTDADVDVINSFKENLMKIKITTFKEENVEIYAFDKVPMLIDLVDSSVKLPTVFLCWKFPHIVSNISTESFVLNKLKNGADLFSPGVINQSLMYEKSNFKVNEPIYINLSTNKAAVAVGIALVDKGDFLANNAQSGKVVSVYHVVGDYLYKLHPDPTVPDMGLPQWALQEENVNKAENITNGGDESKSDSNTINPTLEGDVNENEESTEKSPEENEKDKLNEMLEYCFLKALKTVPKNSYPILPATFYANHVLTSLPSGGELNIKKTKWKKFSVFLQEKSLQGLIKLQQIQRGEYTIAGVESDHRLIREFIDPYDSKESGVDTSKNDASKNNGQTSVQQMFSVSAATLPFFSKFGLKKNDEITRTDVKVHLNDYVKRENLIHPENMEKVRLNPVLYEILKGEEVISRADLLAKMLEKMSIRYKISSTPNVVHKGKMPFIDFEVCTRTGNKKVTLISNLESYGVNVANFSKELQQKAAASTTIITPNVPDKKGPQVQVQGNQILIAVNILKEKHNINEKFMRGLDKAPKAKKKGK